MTIDPDSGLSGDLLINSDFMAENKKHTDSAELRSRHFTKDRIFLIADIANAGTFPFTRGVQAGYVPGKTLDHAAICRLFYSRRKQ